jgi:hypothetical protein
MSIYINTREFIFAYALLAVGAALLGALTLLVAIILFAVSNLFKRLKNGRERQVGQE